MKKFIVIFFAILVLLFFSGNYTKEEIIIPNESIRIRVIANSNSENDQKLKSEVKKSIQLQLNHMLKDASNIDEVRQILKENLNDVEYTVEKTISNYKTDNNNFDINFGYNYFPQKTYKGINYEEGYYESVVISLGKSSGDNWWCVLFPPLCLVDEEENMEEIEYKSFIKEILNKYF